MPYKVIIYDDNQMLRNSIAALLNLTSNFEVVATMPNPVSVLADIEVLQPQVVLMDIDMPEVNGVEAVKIIRNQYADLPIIMLTVFEDNENIFNAICAGASGYLLKKANPDTIATAILEVLDGGAPMTSSVAKKVLQLFPRPTKKDDNIDELLSKRETELLQFLVKGCSYKMIAAQLNISIETVRTHIKKIYRKLQVNSATEAVYKVLNNKNIL